MFLEKPILVALVQCMIYMTTGFLLDNTCSVPPPCRCQTNGIGCYNAGLQSVPVFSIANLTGSYVDINLAYNYITEITDNTFKNIIVKNTTSVVLKLQNNFISNLTERCFEGIENTLYIINLTSNLIRILPSAFRNLPKLHELHINKNPLTTIDPSTMVQLGRHLNDLEIDLSSFGTWPAEMHFLRELKSLVLHSIPFNSLQHDAFQGFRNTLTSLSIINSDLEYLPVAICHLRHLHTLFFVRNYNLVDNLMETEACHFVNNDIARLVLRENNIERLPQVLRNGSIYSILDVGHNKITLIQENLVPSCTVYRLNLDNNLLTRIPYVLNRLQSLFYLDLSGNNIISIEEPDLEKMTDLRTLYLRGNSIQYISNRAFVHNLLLSTIDLTNNNFKTFPEAVWNALGLHIVALDGNSIDCSCTTFHQSSWNISHITITGDCKYSMETLQSFLATVHAVCR